MPFLEFILPVAARYKNEEEPAEIVRKNNTEKKSNV